MKLPRGQNLVGQLRNPGTGIAYGLERLQFPRSGFGLGAGVGFTLALVIMAGIIWRFLIPPRETGEAAPMAVLAGKADDLKPNSGKIIKFGRKPVILIKTPSGEIRAFTAICTHLACTVQYRKDFQHIWCACHNGHYNLQVINIAGPPPRPLEPYSVNVKDAEIFVSRRA